MGDTDNPYQTHPKEVEVSQVIFHLQDIKRVHNKIQLLINVFFNTFIDIMVKTFFLLQIYSFFLFGAKICCTIKRGPLR